MIWTHQTCIVSECEYETDWLTMQDMPRRLEREKKMACPQTMAITSLNAMPFFQLPCLPSRVWSCPSTATISPHPRERRTSASQARSATQLGERDSPADSHHAFNFLGGLSAPSQLQRWECGNSDGVEDPSADPLRRWWHVGIAHRTRFKRYKMAKFNEQQRQEQSSAHPISPLWPLPLLAK